MNGPLTSIIIIIIFINSAALSKIRRAAGTCPSVLTKRCAFRRRAKVAVDSVDRRSSAGKLFQVSGPETVKFLRPMAVAVRCTSSLPEAADRRCHHPVRWTTGRHRSARYGAAGPSRHLDACWTHIQFHLSLIRLISDIGACSRAKFLSFPRSSGHCRRSVMLQYISIVKYMNFHDVMFHSHAATLCIRHDWLCDLFCKTQISLIYINFLMTLTRKPSNNWSVFGFIQFSVITTLKFTKCEICVNLISARFANLTTLIYTKTLLIVMWKIWWNFQSVKAWDDSSVKAVLGCTVQICVKRVVWIHR